MQFAFLSRLFDRLKSQDARLAKLSHDEKRAVLSLMHGITVVDGVISANETEALKTLAARLGIPMGEWLGLPEAVAILALQPSLLKLASLVVADAFFVDGDFDDAEQRFVTTFGERFHLPANPLRDAVEALRKHKLDEALAEWNHEINTQSIHEDERLET